MWLSEHQTKGLRSLYSVDTMDFVCYTATAVCRGIYRSNEKNIIASLKFAGYIHNHKILPGNTFGLILKKKMAATGVYSTFSKEFVGHLEQRVI